MVDVILTLAYLIERYAKTIELIKRAVARKHHDGGI
jgi:hypothetical protein